MPREHTDRPLSSKSHWIVLCILIAVQIAIIWAFPHFATQDGPAHLYNAALLRNIHSPEWPGIAETYQLNPSPVPNWTTAALLAGLFSFLQPAVAEKILVTGYFVFFCTAFVYALRSLHQTADEFSILSLLLANNFLLGMGFYSFCYGLVLFLLAFGYWMRRQDQIRWPHAIALAGLGVAAYFSHIFTFLMIAFFIGVTAACYSLQEWISQGRSQRPGWFPLLKRIVIPELALLPCLLMALIFLRGASHAEHIDRGLSFRERLLLYPGLFVLVNTRSRLDMLYLGLFALFLAGGIYFLAVQRVKLRKATPIDGLLAISAVCAALYIVTPDSLTGGGFVSDRLAWFAICAALFWIACQEWKGFSKKVAVWTAVVMVGVSLISEVQWRARISHFVDAYDEGASVIQPGSEVLSLCYCNPAGNSMPALAVARPVVLAHAGSLSALRSHAVLLYNYEAIGNTFPIEYRPGADFFRSIPSTSFATLVSNMAKNPQLVDLHDFERRASKKIDYVLLWGGPTSDGPETWKFPLYWQLRSGYQLVFTSSPPSQLRIFRRSENQALK